MILSAGIVLVRWDEDEWKFLFLRAYTNWDFPKGVVEPNENPLEAAKREVQEETGIQDLRFRWGYAYQETEPYSGGKKVARYYLAQTRSSKVVFSINPEIGRPEHHEYRWVSYPELKELAPARLQPVVQWAGENLGIG
ncbi:MAG: NUDIX domain-containing protein [Deltaproteobacteria bacterium]|nr:NUDIX domain-containing protein [Deltaproteobacteria bacterium]